MIKYFSRTKKQPSFFYMLCSISQRIKMFWSRNALLLGNYSQHKSDRLLTTLKMRTQVCIKGIFMPNKQNYVKFSRKTFKLKQAKGNTIISRGRKCTLKLTS